MIRSLYAAVLTSTIVLLGACGGGGGGSGTDNADDALLQEINALFPYVPDQPLDQLFVCAISGSSLTWYLNLFPSGSLEIYTTLNNGTDILRNGTYTQAGGNLTISASNDVLFLDETTTQVDTTLGMISHFVTPQMECYTGGHRYNATVFGDTVHYSCPDANIQAASTDSNAIEFAHRNVPFSFVVAGSAFRQRDRYVTGAVDPLVTRGYGIYRRSGDDFYIYFPPGQFDDHDYLSGRFMSGDTAIVVEQEVVSTAPCPVT